MSELCQVPLVALLVEDDAADAELIDIRLAEAGLTSVIQPIHLLHSRTAGDGCAMLEHTRVDAIVLDLTLPDARGLEALHRIHAVAGGTPIIVLTGLADQALAMRALRAGAQDYVHKPPPDGATLLRIIHYACERQRLLQQLDASSRSSALAERQWRLLADISEALALSHDLDRAVERVAGRIVPAVADCFLLFLAGKRDAAHRWHLHGHHAPPLRDAVEALLRRHGPDAVQSLAFQDALHAALASNDLAGGIAVPLHDGRRMRGLLVLASVAAHPDAITDEAFARAVADRLDTAFAQARLLRKTQRAVAARDRAVSIVSHDLRNPLNTIQICTRALLDPEPPPPGGVRHMGELIQRSAAWMQDIVEDLLDRAALDTGRLALHRRPTSVEEIMSSARYMFAAMAQAAKIDLVLRCADHLPPLDADPHRLLQAMNNLVGNAMKFTPGGGRVEITAEKVSANRSVASIAGQAGDAIRFSVRDTGCGILASELSHVFDWFWHSPREGKTGVGLGLAIAKGIVEAHRGRLHVESEPDMGSTFWFTIPAVGSARGAHTPKAHLGVVA